MNKKVLTVIIVVMAILLVSVAFMKIRDNKPVDPGVENVTSTHIVETEPVVVESGENWGVIEDAVFTEPVESTATAPKETAPKETESKETEPKETEPKPTEPKPTEPKPVEPDQGEMTFEKYMKLTSAEQQAFYETFESVDAFLNWYDAAQAEYESTREFIDISGGNVNIGDLMG